MKSLGCITLDSIKLIGPNLLVSFLQEYSQICDLGSFDYIPSSAAVHSHCLLQKDFYLETVPVLHVESSFACILKSSKFKILYTGDTRPTTSIVGPGYGCDLLIHEATFDNENALEAIKKNHSTWGEAISIAQQ